MKRIDEITAEVKELIAASLKIPVEEVTEESKLSDLTEDSIQLFEVLLAFEKAYGVETTYEDVIQLHTVQDVINYVQKVKYSG